MYPSDFVMCMKYLNDAEGVFSNDPDDAGGKTKYGITEATAKACGYKGRIEDLTPNEAERIYYKVFWYDTKIGMIDNVEVKLLIFMFAINKNPRRAIQCLQEGFNLVNFKGRYGPDLKTDGILGPITLKSINRLKDDRRLLYSVRGEVVYYYRTITKRKPIFRKYYAGWLSKRIYSY